MIIKSLLDNDLYKFTMGQIIWKQHPNAQATYKFYNRGTQKFSEDFFVIRPINPDPIILTGKNNFFLAGL